MKKESSGHIKSLSINIVIKVVFADVFEEFYFFAAIMDPLLTLSIKLKIKIQGNNRMSSKL